MEITLTRNTTKKIKSIKKIKKIKSTADLVAVAVAAEKIVNRKKQKRFFDQSIEK